MCVCVCMYTRTYMHLACVLMELRRPFRSYICMHVCVYVQTLKCACVGQHIHTYTHTNSCMKAVYTTQISSHMFLCLTSYKYIHTCIHTYLCRNSEQALKCTYIIYIHTYIHTYMHACIHTSVDTPNKLSNVLEPDPSAPLGESLAFGPCQAPVRVYVCMWYVSMYVCMYV